MAKAKRTIKKASKPAPKKGGQPGNTNALVWTEDEVLSKLSGALNAINHKCYFLSEVAVAIDLYPEWFSRMAEKYNENPFVYQAIKKLYAKCEAIITRKTAESEIVPSLGIFILKAYHDLVEVSKVQQENKNTNYNYNAEPLTPEKIKEIRKNLENEC